MLSMAAAGIVGTIVVKSGLVPKQLALDTWIEPIADFFQRYGKSAILLLALIGLYRISDIVAGVISNVFYQDMGFTKEEILDVFLLHPIGAKFREKGMAWFDREFEKAAAYVASQAKAQKSKSLDHCCPAKG